MAARPTARRGLAVLLLAACGPTGEAPAQGPGGRPAKATAMRPDRAPPERPARTGPRTDDDPCENVRIERSEHLAGAAQQAGKAENDWDPSFEGGPATRAELSEPYFAVQDAAGRVYVADKYAHAVRRIDPDGTIHTHAGTNAPGDGPDAPTPPRSVALQRPNGLFLTPDGALFVLDLDNAKVRRVAPDGAAMETVLRADTDFGKGRGLWVRGDTIFVAAGTRLVSGRPGGPATTAWDGFVSLGNLLGEPDGALLAADRGGDRVVRLVPGEPPRPFFGGGATDATEAAPTPATEIRTDGPRSVVRLAPGLHLVAEHEGGRIFCVAAGRARPIFDRARAPYPFEHEGPPIGAMRGLARAPDGTLLLVHADVGAVHRLHLAGVPR